MIGTLGSSGFIGMAFGPVAADFLLSSEVITRNNVSQMFNYAALMALAAFFVAAGAVLSSKKATPRKRKSPPTWWLVRRYQPGRILMIGFAMGMGIGIPFSFVRTYAESIQVPQIRGYFLMYAVTAFAVRVKTRRLPDLWGVRPTILLGASLLCCSLASFLVCRRIGTRVCLPSGSYRMQLVVSDTVSRLGHNRHAGDVRFR
jgi:MFS family permease